MIRVRIAPSPTGPFHVGTARTTLFNYLYAKKNKGKFILRIEDTDPKRSKEEFEKDIIEELKWLGLKWDEGPDIGGGYGPYRQSKRFNIYQKYAQKLLREGKAYYCFCTPEELEKEKEEMVKKKIAPRYSGKCRDLAPKQVEDFKRQGRKPIIRFKVPEKTVRFNDLVHGQIKFDSGLFGDIAIMGSDGTPLYNFSCVIDDYLMKISHVIRGDDHLSNTPKQILIYEALGWKIPEFGHIPLILNPDRTKMSKRTGEIRVSGYRKQGYLPEALVNFMALLGWNPGSKDEIFSMNDLIKKFSLDRVQKGGAVFNIERLNWINGYYIRKMNLDKFVQECLPYLFNKGLITPIWSSGSKNLGESFPVVPQILRVTKYKICETGEEISIDQLKKIIGLEQERMKKISEVDELTEFFFKKELEYDPKILAWKDMSQDEVIKNLELVQNTLGKTDHKKYTTENLERILRGLSQDNKLEPGKILWPLRVALTGRKASPGVFEVAEILSKEKVLKRIGEGIRKLKVQS